MSLYDEINKLRRVLRVHLRFAGTDNPAVSGGIGGSTPNLFGKVADNSGLYPVRGSVTRFGSFARALTNIDQGFETPSITSEMLDEDNQWRRWASRPWNIVNRVVYYTLRAQKDDGLPVDADIAWGQVTEIQLPSGRAELRVEQMAGDFFGWKVPRRKITLDDWPNADPSVIGAAVPIIYGKLDNTIGAVTNFTGSLVGPSGSPVTGLTAVAAAGGYAGGPGSAPGSNGPYYAVAPVDIDALDDAGYITAPPVVVGPVSVAAGQKVTVSWSAPASGSPGAYRVWRGGDPDFLQMDRYRDAHAYLPDDVSSATLTIDDLYPGFDNRDPPPDGSDPKWDLNYRTQVYYWVSAIVGGVEQPAAGPVVLFLSPVNKKGIRKVSLSWTAALFATGYKLRRASQTYHYEYGFDREWTLGAVTSHEDFLNDTTTVDLPENFGRQRPGAVECLLVDANPNATAGQYKYLVAGHGCKEIREVYVTKSPVKASGNPVGSLDRPKNVALSVGTAGTTVWRYKVSATSSRGETLCSAEVSTRTGAASPNNTITWDAVEDAGGYAVYRAGEGEDFKRLITISSGTSYTDDGSATLTGDAEPENNTTSQAYESAQETTPAVPVLQTENTDYFVEAQTINGNRYQILRFNASQEGNPVTCNVWGIENAGTATGVDDGGTLITRSLEQFKHFLLNWVFNSYRSGSWFSDTGYQTGMLDTVSFETAQEVSDARISGGYVGAGILNEEIDVRQAIQDWVISCDVDWYFWNGKFKVRMFDTSVADRALLPQYTPQNTIFRETFQCSMDVSKVANRIPWQAGPQFDGWFIGGTEEDTDYQTPQRYGRAIEAPVVSMMWTRDTATARDVAQRRLLMVKNPPVYASFTVPLSALDDEISTLIAVTHWDGISPVSTGWTTRACKILRSDIDLDKLTVSIQVQDIDSLLLALGYVYYGDRTWDASDRSYVTALSEKSDVYLYLADRTTGKFSNGALGKRLASR